VKSIDKSGTKGFRRESEYGGCWTARTVGGAMCRRRQKRKKREIIKEGLSEYLITHRRHRNDSDGWRSAGCAALRATVCPVPIKIANGRENMAGHCANVSHDAKNTESQRGRRRSDGVVRVFRNNGRDGSLISLSKRVKTFPSGDKIESIWASIRRSCSS